MPYIKHADKVLLETGQLLGPRNKGELNYMITTMMLEYLEIKSLSYTSISEALGAAIDAAEEMRRRLLGPYEDKKIMENGDVYEHILNQLNQKGK